MVCLSDLELVSLVVGYLAVGVSVLCLLECLDARRGLRQESTSIFVAVLWPASLAMLAMVVVAAGVVAPIRAALRRVRAIGERHRREAER